ncbi:TetR family transcriptional regulator [Nocardia sp. SYP-A9097]|uniref:TetR/AcrR family transcriptional regulator n=1 Tax=Nocardia sp. SYP-A9097 TaxID=2663237 RepID=UPI00129A8730|nr:TetR/AcrR family transcriptional regulator [Nocardia sp. SYP-A9097]MRH92213.1 TetR family transcriptional regulator [Nocardia sp. SYP-A9097]
MPRADAARNRSLVIDAAAAELAEHGLDVSIARIAVRAGVAKGTVFNHFASKEDLVAAIFCGQLATLTATGETLLGHPSPYQALLEFMTAGTELQVSDRSFCEAATTTSRNHPAVRAASDHLADIAEKLTARARHAGAIRDDITGRDIVLLLSAPTSIATPVAGTRPDLWRRYLHLILDALRPETAHPLPVAAPTTQDFTSASSG